MGSSFQCSQNFGVLNFGIQYFEFVSDFELLQYDGLPRPSL